MPYLLQHVVQAQIEGLSHAHLEVRVDAIEQKRNPATPHEILIQRIECAVLKPRLGGNHEECSDIGWHRFTLAEIDRRQIILLSFRLIGLVHCRQLSFAVAARVADLLFRLRRQSLQRTTDIIFQRA